MEKDKVTSVKLSKPAHRALANAGIATLKQLSRFSQKEVSGLHGIGPSSIPKLKEALKGSRLSFAEKKDK